MNLLIEMEIEFKTRIVLEVLKTVPVIFCASGSAGIYNYILRVTK